MDLKAFNDCLTGDTNQRGAGNQKNMDGSQGMLGSIPQHSSQNQREGSVLSHPVSSDITVANLRNGLTGGIETVTVPGQGKSEQRAFVLQAPTEDVEPGTSMSNRQVHQRFLHYSEVSEKGCTAKVSFRAV